MGGFPSSLKGNAAKIYLSQTVMGDHGTQQTADRGAGAEATGELAWSLRVGRPDGTAMPQLSSLPPRGRATLHRAQETALPDTGGKRCPSQVS